MRTERRDAERRADGQISRMAPGETNSAVQAIRRGTDGYLYPASDPRKNGLAAGY